MKKFSRHHVLWNRRDYLTLPEKQLRSHQGLVATIPNQIHYAGFPESIHTLLDAPPKPTIGRIVGALALLDSQSDRFLRCPEQAIELVAQYFGTHGEEATGNHLYQQLDIMEGQIQHG